MAEGTHGGPTEEAVEAARSGYIDACNEDRYTQVDSLRTSLEVALRRAYPVIRRDVARDVISSLRDHGAGFHLGHPAQEWTTRAADFIAREFGGTDG